MKERVTAAAVMLASCFCACAQNELQLADSIVKYQMQSGGWPKNQKWLVGADAEAMSICRETGIGSTIDNGATVGEMKSLVAAVKVLDKAAGDETRRDKTWLAEKKRYQESFLRGLCYLLEMQYGNGGFPQFYPPKRNEDYSTHITFNDNAMVRVLKLLRDIAGSDDYNCMGVTDEMKERCGKAVAAGVECILRCQIRVDDKGRVVSYGSEAWNEALKTVWCQQHDEVTFFPAKARAYELPSYTGYGETVDILEFLMSIESPSDEIRSAVECGVKWLEAHAMRGAAVERFVNDEGKSDLRITSNNGDRLLWARFYDLEEAMPYFCDRDGVPRRSMSDIGYERRNGYSWVGDSPQRVISLYYNMYARKK